MTLLLLCTGIVRGQSASEAWVQRYNSVEVGSEDHAYFVVADPEGNVIVAGKTDDATSGPDILVIKYSAAGLPVWTNRYNGAANWIDGANALAVDNSGNVIVTGSSIEEDVNNLDWITIAYSATGVPLWTNFFKGPSNGYDAGAAVAVDHSTNVIVTGVSQNSSGQLAPLTISYSALGQPLWTNYSHSASGRIAVDNNGNVFVTGSGYVTTAYSSTGLPLWTNRYYGPASNDNAYAISTDTGGNVFVTGFSQTGSNYYDTDYATIAYSASGLPLWTNRYNGPDNREDRATDLAVDNSGNIIVTGSSSLGIGLGSDYATVAYSGIGVPLWTNRYSGPGNRDDRAEAVSVDDRGNTFVTGNSYGTGLNTDYATIAYSAMGVPVWTNRYNPASNSSDLAYSVTVNNRGNVFVTGSSTGSGRSADFATIAYSGAGLPIWTNHYNATANSNDFAYAIAVDDNGNAYVTGASTDSAGSYQFATIAYSGGGLPLWTNHYNGPGDSVDVSVAVAAGRRQGVRRRFFGLYAQWLLRQLRLCDHRICSVGSAALDEPLRSWLRLR